MLLAGVKTYHFDFKKDVSTKELIGFNFNRKSFHSEKAYTQNYLPKKAKQNKKKKKKKTLP